MIDSNIQSKINALRANGLETEAREVERLALEKQINAAKAQILPPVAYTTDQWLAKLITQDLHMIEQKTMCKLLAPLPDPVLITGPTGTGKELLAQALHGTRFDDFVELNCAGLPVHLIEHELFGSVAGAFTGSIKEKQGLFQSAREGTVFLDEIGELPLEVQAKLLRAIETYKVRKVGSNKLEEIKCRFVAATQQPLEQWVKEGKFREDLYYRLNTFQLSTTPLTSRIGDCKPIADYYFKNEFPFNDWSINKHRLTGNVRTIKQLVRRYQVFGKLMF